MLYIIAITTVSVIFMILRIYVGVRVPELKRKVWNLSDLKDNKKVYRVAQSTTYFCIVFVAIIIILDNFVLIR